MHLSQYQKESRKTAVYPRKDQIVSYGGWLYAAVGLGGETGEILNNVQKIMRDCSGDIWRLSALEYRDGIYDEMGDVLWYLAQLATELGIDLNDLARDNLKKLQSRQERGVLGGSGDKR